ncbi:hypothetical protein D1007_58756 [Hordeum vulgare]|nr:hypothetical protein D1007_58756 [Hordeum vulgare]
MFYFVDKLVSCIADNCTCCKAFGRKECRLKNEDDIDAENATTPNNESMVFVTPISNKINTRLEGIFANKGSSCGNSSIAHKRNCVMGSSNATESSKKICAFPNEPIQVRTPSGMDILNKSSLSAKDGARNQVANIVYSFFDDLTASLVSYYAELIPSSNYVTFGTTNDVVLTKIRLCKMAHDRWKWIVHPKPRLISIDGIELHQRLSGSDQLSHEMGAIIFRRFGQMDKFYSKDTATMIWRKFMEPDFSIAALSNADPLTIESIRTSFTEGGPDWNPASSRLGLHSLHGILTMRSSKSQSRNLEGHKNWLLYKVLRMDGNNSMIPLDAIEAIKGSFVAL